MVHWNSGRILKLHREDTVRFRVGDVEGAVGSLSGNNNRSRPRQGGRRCAAWPFPAVNSDVYLAVARQRKHIVPDSVAEDQLTIGSKGQAAVAEPV